jgi:hypothetical protein
VLSILVQNIVFAAYAEKVKNDYLAKLDAVRQALHYDLTDCAWAEKTFSGAAEQLWRANMRGWKAAQP